MYYRTPANKITTSWKKWYLSAHINIIYDIIYQKYAKLIVEIFR